MRALQVKRFVQGILFFLVPSFLVQPEDLFLCPNPQDAYAVARRSCQGWPSRQPLCKAPMVSGHALTAASTTARWHWPGRRLRGEPAFCGAMRLVPHPCIRWVAKTHTHDAIMRIGGEAPRRRAHSTPRHESHVGARVAATSNRHRQTVMPLRDAPKLSGVRRQIASRGADQLTPDA